MPYSKKKHRKARKEGSGNRIEKQLRYSLLLLLVISLFVSAGVYLYRHPIRYPWDEETDLYDFSTTSVYLPYQSVEQPQETESLTETAQLLSFTEAPATEQSRFYTVKKACVFTFSGLKNAQELDGVLNALKRTGSRATFFVTAAEMEQVPEQIRTIRDAGHSLGISVIPDSWDSLQELYESLQNQSEMLRTQYGVSEEIFLRCAYGAAPADLLQVAGSGGFQVLSERFKAVPDKVLRLRTAQEILSAVFGESAAKLQRGEIVHFQMGILQGDGALLGELVEAMIQTRCIYPVVPAAAIAEDRDALYEYPVREENMLPGVANAIYPGHLANMTEEEKYEVIRRGYLGTDWVCIPGFLPGFSMYEFNHLDKRGLIENDENYVFLTFDDWGTDENVNKLLAVLKEHNAIGTFFVRTNHVPGNPNLLRAIAADGHTIGCHTHNHLRLSNTITRTEYADLSAEQVEELREDLVTSYETLQQIVGDMRDPYGKPSLSRLFRPPTLAVGKNGLETVFDCGFRYSVSGFFSSEDYKAKNASDLALQILYHIHSGSIIVLHFSDNSKYTAEALEIVFSKLEGTKYRFAGLNAVL